MEKGFFDFKSIATKIGGKKVTTILLIIGFVGIALIFLSDYFHPSSGNSINQSNSNSSNDSSSVFEAKTESKLENIIGSISGVGRVKVMVTIESGVENVYETDNKNSSDKTQNGGGSNEQTQQNGSSESSHVVLNNSSGGEEALLSKQLQPEILGVVVVCDGGNNPDVKENVVDTVSTALGLPTNCISVNEMQPNKR